MEWSFRYAGPFAKVDDRDCIICTSVATKRCRDHGNADESCSKCNAAKSGICQSHQGLASALEAHKAILHLTDHGAVQWRRVKNQPGHAPNELGMTGGDIGRRQEKKADPQRDDRAARQYEAAANFALALFGNVEPDTEIEVVMRGDADVPGNNPLTVHIEAKIA